MVTESQRVYYNERQRLEAADLSSEQAYLIALDTRHYTREHSSGIVHGLNLKTIASSDSVIQPGTATDDFGRTIVLTTAYAVPVPPAGGDLDVWLIYRILPLRLRQPGRYDCGPIAFQRWQEFGEIITTPVTANAAPSSPEEGAVYLGRIGSTPTPDITYMALFGSLVRDPGQRTLMQVGPLTGHDRNGFVVRADNGSGTLTSRLLIDRQGNNILYGTVTLLNYRARAVVPGPDKQSRIVVEAKRPGQVGEHIQVGFGSSGRAKYSLRFWVGQKQSKKHLDVSMGAGALDQDAITRFNETSALVRLTLLTQGGGEPLSDAVVTGQDIALTPRGGMLVLGAWPDPPTPNVAVLRGCAGTGVDDTGFGKEPNGLSFLAMSSPQKGTPLPAVYSVKVEDNKKQVEQLRFDLGIKKDTDPSTRLAIGAESLTAKEFKSWLEISGNCMITLFGGNSSDPGNPPKNLKVTGTIEQPPLKPDVTEPTFLSLVVWAFQEGLARSKPPSTVVQLAFENLPAQIKTDNDWSYSILVNNQGVDPVNCDKLIEIRTINEKTLLMSIGAQIFIPAKGNQKFQVTHRAQEMGPGELSIEVRISGKIGNLAWWKSVSTPSPIPVVDSPISIE